MHIQYDDNRPTMTAYQTAFQTIFLEKKILNYKQNYSLKNDPSNFISFFLGGGGGLYLSINNLRLDATDHPPVPTDLVKLEFIDRDVGVELFPLSLPTIRA